MGSKEDEVARAAEATRQAKQAKSQQEFQAALDRAAEALKRANKEAGT